MTDVTDLSSPVADPSPGDAEGGVDAHGGEHAVAVAAAHGVDTMFTLSGAHVFPMYDGAVHADPPMRIVDVRHEQTAVFAAEAVGKLTRVPGLAVLTAGPGVTNGVSAVTQARFSGSPLVVVGGRAPANRWGMGSLQELDHPPLLDPVTKLARTVPTVGAIPGAVDEAFRVAGRPAPRAHVPRRADGPVLRPGRRRAADGRRTPSGRARPRRAGRDRRAARRGPAAGPRARHRRVVGRRGGVRPASRGDARAPGRHQRHGPRGRAGRAPAAGEQGARRRPRQQRPRRRRRHPPGLPAGLRGLRRQGRRARGARRARRGLARPALRARRPDGLRRGRPDPGPRRHPRGGRAAAPPPRLVPLGGGPPGGRAGRRRAGRRAARRRGRPDPPGSRSTASWCPGSPRTPS